MLTAILDTPSQQPDTSPTDPCTIAPAAPRSAPLIAIGDNDMRAATLTISGDVAGGSIIKDSDVTIVQAAALTPEQTQAQRNRSHLLAEVRSFWIAGVLEESLHKTAMLHLGLAERPDAVASPWALLVQQPDEPEPLPPSTTIAALFDQQGGELLILGAPGAGKTTLLLTLARTLLDRAEADEQHPIPVVFTLSSWAEKALPLTEWLAEELNERYDVPRPVGTDWVARNSILPLLDGLDEVREEQRADCVTAINTFRHSQGVMPMVVCSRVADYEAVAERLKLNGAVLVQPLTQAQIDDYLDHGGAQLAPLRAALADDATLREMVETPLILSMVTLAYCGAEIESRPMTASLDERRRHLFALYVEKMFERRGVATSYTPQETVRWLARLAQMQARQGQSVFFVDQLQPTWLPTAAQRWWYTLSEGIAITTIVGLIVGLYYALGASVLHFTMHGPLAGLGDPTWHVPGYLRALALVGSGLALGGTVGALVGVALGWLFAAGALPPPAATRREERRNKWRAGIAIGLASALVSFVVVACFYTLFGALIHSIILGTCLALGVRFVVRPGQIRIVETFHWSSQRAKVGMCIGMATGMVLGMLYSTTRTNAHGLWDVLLLALGFCFKGGLIGSLLGGATYSEMTTRTVSNQGIHRSAISALRIGCAAWLVMSLVAAMLLGFLVDSNSLPPPAQIFGHEVWLLGGLVVSMAPALLFALAFGGYACLQHAILRLVLWRSGAAPLRYCRFLDHCDERILLRKVGGGYLFVHRLLLDYFTSLSDAR